MKRDPATIDALVAQMDNWLYVGQRVRVTHLPITDYPELWEGITLTSIHVVEQITHQPGRPYWRGIKLAAPVNRFPSGAQVAYAVLDTETLEPLWEPVE